MLLPEDKEEYRRFLQHHFDGLAKRRSLVPLHHYTNGASLISIIESGKLWATQIAYMNDAKEIIHAVELLRNAIFEKEKLGVTSEFSVLLRKMLELLAYTTPETDGPFVICFSEQKDDLSQWRAYGGSEGGYAIEFNIKLLLRAAMQNNGFLVPVIYDENGKNTLLTDIIKWTEIYFMKGLEHNCAPSLEEWADEFSDYWLGTLSYLAPILKHSTFRDEKEWRFILFGDKDVRKLQFIERQSMMTRHFPVNLSESDANGYSPLPIENIMVGPKIHQRLSQISVGHLLASKGYSADEVGVTITEIPFRTAR